VAGPTFDVPTKGDGRWGTRRLVSNGLAGALVGLGLARTAAAVETEGADARARSASATPAAAGA